MSVKSLNQRTQRLQFFLHLTMAILACAVLADIYDFFTYFTLDADIDPHTTVFTSDRIKDTVGIAQSLLYYITFIVFCQWVHRVSKNLRALTEESIRFSPGWAVGWFFVPIASLYKPYQVMKEIWYISHKKTVFNHGPVDAWWALYIIALFLGKIAENALGRAVDAEGYAMAAIAYMLSDGLGFLVCLATLDLVNKRTLRTTRISLNTSRLQRCACSGNDWLSHWSPACCWSPAACWLIAAIQRILRPIRRPIN